MNNNSKLNFCFSNKKIIKQYPFITKLNVKETKKIKNFLNY